MHSSIDLTNLALVAVAALGCGILLTRLRQPAIVGYILAGVLLGPTGLGLVEMDLRRRLMRSRDEARDSVSGLGRGNGLLGGKLLLERGLRHFGFGRHLFPKGLLVLRFLEPGFGRFESLNSLVMFSPVLNEQLRQAIKLDAQVSRLVFRRLRNDSLTK